MANHKQEIGTFL